MNIKTFDIFLVLFTFIAKTGKINAANNNAVPPENIEPQFDRGN